MKSIQQGRPNWFIGGTLRPPRSPEVQAACTLSLLGALLCFAEVAAAQTVLPEQRLSTMISTRYHDPQLRASGPRVFGVWGGADAPPQNLSYGFSLNRGLTWINESILPLSLSGNGVTPPFAMTVDPLGSVNLMVLTSTHYFYRRPQVGLPSWNTPVRAIVSDGHTDDVQSIGEDPAASAIYFAYTHRLDDYVYPIRFVRSLDNGATWSVPVALSSPNCNGSSMAIAPDGTVYVTWVDYALGQILLRRSTDHGNTFSPPIVVTDMLDNLAAVPVGWKVPFGTFGRDYPYYRSGLSGGAPNFPALAIDRSSGPTRGSIYLTWAEHAEGAPAPATTTVLDQEPNSSAATPQPIFLDSDIYGGMPAGGDSGPFDFDWYAFDGVAGQTLVLDGDADSYYREGCTLYEQRPDGSLLTLSFLAMPGWGDPAAQRKPPIITLPRTGRYLLGLGGVSVQGYSYTVRLRRWVNTPSSICRDMRDVVLIHSNDGGTTWSPKVLVNHDSGGSDQHQPNVAVDSQGRVYVAWFDRRESALGDQVRPTAAVSTDGGATFGPDLPLSSNLIHWDSNQAANLFSGELVGDRIALAAGDDFGMAAWTDFRDWPNTCAIYGARIVDIPTAVTGVSDFVAEPVASAVRLRWRVSDARGLSAIKVLRAEQGEQEHVVGTAAVTSAEGNAEYVDASVKPGRAYAYRLRVTVAGSSYDLGPLTVQTLARIDALAWRATGPNPFSQRASVTLAVPRAAEGAVRIYDVQGKVVRTLREGALEPGELRLDWDGRDAAGFEAAPGLYFVAAQVGAERVRAKLTRVR